MKCLCSGYHGCTKLAVDLSEYKFGKVNKKQEFVHVLSCPDYYRYGALPENRSLTEDQVIDKLNQKLLTELKDLIEHIKTKGKRLAAFLMESGMSVAGVLLPVRGLLQQIQSLIHEEGAVFICDEVQTGVYRTGAHFFNFQHSGIQPDIVTLGKVSYL